ncbi:hypothetical protein [Oscillatoria sp. FACHB-1407]|uniref:hypothetical protein n=1 Tax=Oscillatoria sp. FACHB-1407 TaxID=2692847 RepID=UPI0030DAFB97
MSQKHRLFADRVEQLQQRGIGRKRSMLLMAERTTVSLENEWLEAFWCQGCQTTQWYHVCYVEEHRYEVAIAPQEMWRQANGVYPHGNSSVSEFTRRQAGQVGNYSLQDFKMT